MQPVRHAIPSRIECHKCHIANFTAIIGFDELRLNGMLAGATKTQLQDVIDKGMLTAAPTNPRRDITDTNPQRLFVRQYCHANCGHCHNGGMTTESIDRVFSLREDMFVANTINKRTEGRTKPGIRIVPGQPNMSILYEAIARESNDPELNRMPLVGVQLVDKDAVAKFRDWIMSLPAQ